MKQSHIPQFTGKLQLILHNRIFRHPGSREDKSECHFVFLVHAVIGTMILKTHSWSSLKGYIFKPIYFSSCLMVSSLRR